VKSKTRTSSELRRLEAKRDRSERQERAWRKILLQVQPSVLLIWFGFYACALVILLSGNESMPWHLNQRIDRDITARVDFEIEDHIAT